ncbi:MAG: hypothetical protein M3Z87_00060 [Lactobacillus sp.]|nr:hypothetical protein [Lactobacillus sp.]
MKNVIFTHVPFKARKFFKVKVKRSPSIDILTADKCVRDYAETLNPEEVNQISFKLINSNKTTLFECSADVQSSDKEDGLLGVLGRVLLEKQGDEDALNAKIAVESALDSNSSELNNDVEIDRDSSEQQKKQEKTSSTVFTSEDLWKNQKEESEEKTDNEEDEHRTGALKAPALTEEEKPFDISDFEKDIDPVEHEVGDSESTEPPQPTEKEEKTIQDSKQAEAQMMPLDAFLNLDDLKSKLENFSSTAFDINKVLDDLGYTEKPANKYERQLNDAILNALTEKDLSNTQLDYENDQIEATQKLKASLIDVYNTVTDQSITESVENDVQDKILQLESYAAADQDQNNEHATLEEEGFKKRQKERRDIKIRKFQETLEKEDAAAFSSFSEKVRNEARNKNQAIQRTLYLDKEKARRNSRNDLVERRNGSLVDQKLELSAKAEEKVITTYRKHREDFQHNYRLVRNIVLAKSREIDEQKKADEKEAWDRKVKQQTLNEQKRQNDLLEHQNRLKEKENKYSDKSLKEMMKLVYKVQNPSQNQNMSKVSAKKATSSDSLPKKVGVEKKASTTTNNDQHLDEKEKGQVADTPTNKGWKKSKIIGAILFLCLGIAGVLLGLHTLATPAPQNSTPTIKTESKAKPKSKKKAVPLKKEDKLSKKKQVEKKPHKSNNNLDRYTSAKTWAQKVDILNGALGQHDDRALKQINDNYPTNISELYENIVMKNDEGTRKAWKAMLPSERNEVSRGARNAVVLSFYAIKDWQSGWEAKEAING